MGTSRVCCIVMGTRGVYWIVMGTSRVCCIVMGTRSVLDSDGDQ